MYKYRPQLYTRLSPTIAGRDVSTLHSHTSLSQQPVVLCVESVCGYIGSSTHCSPYSVCIMWVPHLYVIIYIYLLL